MSSPALISLGYKVQIGDVQSMPVGKFSITPVECSVNGSFFQHVDAYQIHIASNKVVFFFLYRKKPELIVSSDPNFCSELARPALQYSDPSSAS